MENPLESIHTAATDVAKDYDAAMEYFLSLTTEDGICFDLGDVIPGVIPVVSTADSYGGFS